VQHIISAKHLRVCSGQEDIGTYACCSVTHPTTTIYTGCLGEWACSCPDTGICKHLAAAALQLGFTHNMRKAAAAKIAASQRLRVIDEEEGLISCIPYGAKQQQQQQQQQQQPQALTINIVAGYCNCLDFGQYQICAHLLACSMHPHIKEGCCSRIWQTAVADPGAVLAVKRPRPLPLPDGVTEPLLVLGSAAEMMQQVEDMAAAVRSRLTAEPTGAASASPEQESCKELQRLYNSIARNVQHAPKELIEQLLPQARLLDQQLRSNVPAFVKTRTPCHQARRTDQQRKVVPLFDRRVKSVRKGSAAAAATVAAAAETEHPASTMLPRQRSKRSRADLEGQEMGQQQEVEEKQLQPRKRFAKIQGPGRPASKTRGLGNMAQRGKKAGRQLRQPAVPIAKDLTQKQKKGKDPDKQQKRQQVQKNTQQKQARKKTQQKQQHA
jgi:hypothetical protein